MDDVGAMNMSLTTTWPSGNHRARGGRNEAVDEDMGHGGDKICTG